MQGDLPENREEEFKCPQASLYLFVKESISLLLLEVALELLFIDCWVLICLL